MLKCNVFLDIKEFCCCSISAEIPKLLLAFHSKDTIMSRFTSISPEEMERIILNKDAKNTKKQMETFFATLTDYLVQKRITFSFKTASKEDIDRTLRQFWMEVRKIDREMYKVSSFKSMRSAIQRKLKQLRGEDFDITNDTAFNKSNTAFDAQKTLMKQQGLGLVTRVL